MKIHKVWKADDAYSEKRNSGIEQCVDYRASWR